MILIMVVEGENKKELIVNLLKVVKEFDKNPTNNCLGMLDYRTSFEYDVFDVPFVCMNSLLNHEFINHGTEVHVEPPTTTGANIELLTKQRDEAISVLRLLPIDHFTDDMATSDSADFVDHAREFHEAMNKAREILVQY